MSVVLNGREAETAALDGLLARAADGEGSGLVLWGEPGIGKTALLDHAVAASAGTVLRCRGTRMEAGLAFSALHELLWPVQDRVETLPAPQASALRGALGLSSDTANRFLIGAAVLSLVSALARDRPVLFAVDDAQWIDEATAQCLGFVARRVRTEPVVVLLAGHDDPASGPWEGVPAWEVLGLADDDAGRVVGAVVPDADPALIERIVRAAGGNPLALTELPTLAAEFAGEADLTDLDPPVPVGPRLRRAFRARAEALEPPTRALLLLAAAEDRGDRDVVRRACASWGIGATAWDEAERSGLLRVRSRRLTFRHPLIRVALYDGATFPVRQAAHLALAAALGEHAVEERAWHLAAAADGADEDVAALLEQAAERCLGRSAGPTAARALRRSAELSPRPADAARRLAIAARAAWDAGHAGAARQLLDDAERLVDVAAVVRLSGGLRGILEFARGTPERAYHYLVDDMALVLDTRGAVELGTVAVRAAWSAGRPDLQRSALRRLLALDTGGDADLSRILPVLQDWWACYDETSAGARAAPDAGVDTVTQLVAVPWELLPPGPLVQAWARDGPLHDVLRVQVTQLRRREELAALAMVLAQTAFLDFGAGRWELSEAGAAEGMRLAEEIGADHLATQCRLSLARLAAARGDNAAVDEHTTRALAVAVPRGVRGLSSSGYWCRGQASLFDGRPQDALDQLTPLTEPGHDAAHPTFGLLAAADTAEAAAQLGRADIVESRTVELEAWTRRTKAGWARRAAHRLRALAAEGVEAETSYRAALDDPGSGDNPFEQARTRLLYGEWLRRARRRADARRELAGAAETFGRLAASPLHARALRELALAEGRVARRESGSAAPAGLTAQEMRVAQLAAEGLTNRQIAEQLLISHRTVGHHLASVYAKLGVTSRGELALVDVAGDLRFNPIAPER